MEEAIDMGRREGVFDIGEERMFKGVFKFDYKEMLGDWWQEHNDRAREEAERETYEVY